MSKTRLYFAYGSNINLEQMAYRCPDARVIGPVTLDGYELTFRGRANGIGVANIEPKEGASVPGLLWRITPKCEESLDRYEGAPRLYVQQDVTVRDSRGGRHTVMAYVMTGTSRAPAMPSASYFNGIRDGYRQNGMDETPLADALEQCRRAASERTDGRQMYMPAFYERTNHHKKGKNHHER